MASSATELRAKRKWLPVWASRSWSWVKNAWRSIRPTREARTGAMWGALLTIVWAVAVGALALDSGFGLAADSAFALVVALAAIPLAALLVALVLWILTSLPKLIMGFFVAAFVFVSLLWWGESAYVISAILLFVECALGASIATFVLGGLRQASLAKKIITSVILVLSLAANAGIFSLLHSDGIDSELIRLKDNKTAWPPALQIPNPADRGPFAVQTLYYGSGNSLRRPEFGASVSLKTPLVDASAFFKDFSGWKAKLRKLYWGFGMDRLPLNAQVWYPAGPGPFPLVLMVHGNHEMSEPSDKGYAYLGELLASRGFIMASIDENFLNSGLFHDPPKQQAVRGWTLLEHLKLWQQWNQQSGNPFNEKVDMQNIALAGHSRGGEAAATAALFNNLAFYPDDATIRFNYGYKIKSVFAIAPADGQYKPAEQNRVLNDINYFTIQGANDSDVSSFAGSRQFDHVHFSGDQSAFKSELYVYRANHGQFNTVWGRTDMSAPMSWLLNLRPLISGDQQREIGKVYLTAFLEATLHNRKEYIDLFRDYRRGRSWLPDTLYENRYSDEGDKTVCRFDEDADVTTTTVPGGRISSNGLTVWREARIPTRSGTRDYNGVFIGWNRDNGQAVAPRYGITLPTGYKTGSQLLLSIAVSKDKAPKPADKKAKADDKDKKDKDVDIGSETTDFSIQATTTDGVTAKVPVSSYATLLPPLQARFTKVDRLDKLMYKNAAEPVFQTVSIPMSAFTAQNNGLLAANINRIELVFDKTASRVIIVTSIGFEQAAEPSAKIGK